MTQLNIPYRFIAGTKAKANEVNANFDAIASEIDEIYSQMLTNSNNAASDAENLEDAIDAVDEKLDNFLSSFSQKTHFCVNSGNLDATSGDEDILSASTNVVSFDVSSQVPIKATTCSGVEFTVNTIDDLTLPSLSDGVYTIYLFPDGTVDYYALQYKTVNILPSNPYTNEVCLVIGEEPLKALKYSGTQWEDFDGVPLGEFIISSDEISSIKTLPYNQNGYNTNAKSISADLQENGWLMLSNGLIFQWGKYSFSANQICNFPISFPKACFGAFTGGNYNNTASSAHVNIGVYSKSQFQIACGMYSSGALSGTAYVFAVGY